MERDFSKTGEAVSGPPRVYIRADRESGWFKAKKKVGESEQIVYYKGLNGFLDEVMVRWKEANDEHNIPAQFEYQLKIAAVDTKDPNYDPNRPNDFAKDFILTLPWKDDLAHSFINCMLTLADDAWMKSSRFMCFNLWKNKKDKLRMFLKLEADNQADSLDFYYKWNPDANKFDEVPDLEFLYEKDGKQVFDGVERGRFFLANYIYRLHSAFTSNAFNFHIYQGKAAEHMTALQATYAPKLGGYEAASTPGPVAEPKKTVQDVVNPQPEAESTGPSRVDMMMKAAMGLLSQASGLDDVEAVWNTAKIKQKCAAWSEEEKKEICDHFNGFLPESTPGGFSPEIMEYSDVPF